MKLKDSEHLERYLLPCSGCKIIEMTIPDKSGSSKKKYRLKEKGRMLQAKDK
jgi:hypothetical protein